MKRWQLSIVALGVVGAAALGASALRAREASRTHSANGEVAAPGDTAGIDPNAVAALDNMAKYLRTLKQMQVKAVVETQEVSTEGFKVSETSTVDLLAERPNKLRAEIANDRKPRILIYDGSKFTMYAPKLKYYAQVDAPKTIGELADQLEDKYDIDLPLVDLFRWGTPESDFKNLTSAVDVGPSSVDGTTCEQYLFRQEGLEWQIWIQEGAFPLPRKLVLTTLTDDARPQHTSTWAWNLNPSYNALEFAFTPPEGARRIAFIDAATGKVDNSTVKGTK